MKFPLTGKYSYGEVLQVGGRWYFRKTVHLPEHVNLRKTLKSIRMYRKQLKDYGIKTTRLYDSKVDKTTGKITFTEKFYNKNLEIIIGTSSSKIANHFFKRLLKIVDHAFPDGNNPKVVVEIKPSNFLIERNTLLYCDFIPPRIYSKNLENIKLEFYKRPSQLKKRELRYRFLTKEGAYYYLLLHTVSIRPESLGYFIKYTIMTIKDPLLKKSLAESLASQKFVDDVKKFRKFYLLRQKAYKRFVCMMNGANIL